MTTTFDSHFDSLFTGLDSTTAVTVIEALKGIAVNRNSTLIVTIHQPSAKLYAMFDQCLFLAGTYCGVLHCIALYCTVLCCIVLYYTELYCIVGAELWCAILYHVDVNCIK